jgi:integrase
VRRIGKAARVVVDERVRGEEVRTKYASAHDLRRSFDERWALRVMPQVLMELMRHESIETTQKYYVGRNAQRTADVLWAAVETLKSNDSVPSTNRGSAADNAESTEPLATTALS